MKKIINKHMIILLALVVSLLLMTTMYAAINSVTGDIQGKVIAEKQTGVYITDVQYVSDIDADLGASTITNFKGTFMQNTVKLSNTNSASEIKYKVTVYNNSDKSYPFLAVLYDEEFYDNLNIIFEISSEGYKIGDIINPYETRDIFITFKYKDGQIPSNTTLNANLNFKIADPNRMILAEGGPSTGNYLGSSVVKNKIETIKFELGKVEPQGTISSFDASEKQDGSIMGYYTDANSDGLYDLTFASNEPIYANVNASFLFSGLITLKNISFNNFSTFGVNNMEYMFDICAGITALNLSSFNTEQVTDMNSMFSGCTRLKTLDISNFNTSQVADMKYMFTECIEITALNLSNFNTEQVTDMDWMFFDCRNLKTLDISNFNTSQVTNMRATFGYCWNLEKLDVSKFDTRLVTDMSGMFEGCGKIEELNVSNFNTSQVLDMSGMFVNCDSLKSIDLSNFNTSKVTNMNGMFKFCNNLQTIYVSEFNPETNTGWTTSAVTESREMFNDSTKLVGGNGTKYDANHIDKEYARLDRVGTPGYLTNIVDEYLPVAGTMTMKLDNANGAEYVNNTITDRNVYIAVNNGYDTAGGSGHKSTTYTVLKNGQTYLANQTSANTLTQLGTYTITVTTTDNAGNVATRGGYTVRIQDKQPPVAGTMTMKLDNANGEPYTNNTTTERNVYIAVNNGYDTAGGSGHRSTTYTVLKDGKTYLANQTGTNILTEPGTYTITVTTTDNAGNVATRGGYVVKIIENKPKSPSELFDKAGTNPDGLHIGDFINYDAGTWTQAEINAIKVGPKSNLVTANGSIYLPTQQFQFGGFTAGSSRNGNAAPNNSNYNYIKDKETNQPITGWRIFDVEGNIVTLISSGNPEDYCYPAGSTSKDQYIGQYILTGYINSSWANGWTESESYQKRDWNKYVNTVQKAQSAEPLTKNRLESWFSKYIGIDNVFSDWQFQKIYKEPYLKYQNIPDNNSIYWLLEENRYMYYFSSGGRRIV